MDDINKWLQLFRSEVDLIQQTIESRPRHHSVTKPSVCPVPR